MYNFLASKAKTNTTHPRRRSCAGFSVLEIIIVLMITAIISSIATPSIITYVERGRQNNRMNIARTIYLAAQNQMTRAYLEKNLKATMTGDYFLVVDKEGRTSALSEIDPALALYYTDDLDPGMLGAQNVAAALLGNFPESERGAEGEKANDIRYVSKPAGVSPATYPKLFDPDEPDYDRALDGFYNMLDSIIVDKTILNNAIWMEYNIKSGVILALFYGDVWEESDPPFTFRYGPDNPTDISPDNITGGRDETNGYAFATARRQGYFGARSTSVPTEPIYYDYVNIYDGVTKPLTVSDVAPLSIDMRINVLYAEFILEKSDTMNYKFEIVDAADLTVLDSTSPNFASSPDNFAKAIELDPSVEAAVYWDEHYFDDPGNHIYQNSINVSDLYARFVWIIDYIEGDLEDYQPHSIAHKLAYKKPTNLRARAVKMDSIGESASVTSQTIANSHFMRELAPGSYEVASARHLNNIRHADMKNTYSQSEYVEMGLLSDFAAISNFAPIKRFLLDETGITVDDNGYFVNADDKYVDEEGNLIPTGEPPVPAYFSGEYYAMGTSTINNLRINSASAATDDVGLFSRTTNVARIHGLSLVKANISAPAQDNVGAIVGKNEGMLSRVEVKDSNVEGNDYVGVIAGTNTGAIVGTDTLAPVSFEVENSKVAGQNNVGSVAGENIGGIFWVRARGSGGSSKTEVLGLENVGGLVGKNAAEARIRDSSTSNAKVTGTGDYVGGIAGLNDEFAQVSGAAVFGDNNLDVTSLSGRNFVGGIAGSNHSSARIDDSNVNYMRVFGSDNHVGMVSGHNLGQIINTRIQSSSAEGQDFVGGVAGENEHIVSNVKAAYMSVWGKDNVGGITGRNNAEASIRNSRLDNMAITGNSDVGGVAGYNAGEPNEAGEDDDEDIIGSKGHINQSVLSNFSVEGTGDNIGGVVGQNSGEVYKSSATDFTVTGTSNVGGIAGHNALIVEEASAEKLSVLATGDNVGGIAGNNADVLTDLWADEFTIEGIESVGGVVGYNSGLVQTARVSGAGKAELSTVKGEKFVGGIAGDASFSNIDTVMARHVSVEGEDNVGGVAGRNGGKINVAAVEYSTVTGTNPAAHTTGGIAGQNSSSITDVYFLSVADIYGLIDEDEEDEYIGENPISENGGGIVGYNDGGSITRAIYISPSPGEEKTRITPPPTEGGAGTSIDFTTIYPIVRAWPGSGTTPIPASVSGVKDSFYLSGHRYSAAEGRDGTWVNERYSLISGVGYTPIVERDPGNGRGMVTKFIDLDWLDWRVLLDAAPDVDPDELDKWAEKWAYATTTDYPYPVLKALEEPGFWPVTDAPVRPDQVDVPLEDTVWWTDTSVPVTQRPRAVEFPNGDFMSDFLQTLPGGDAVDNVWIPPFNWIRTDWFTVDMDTVDGWYTRPAQDFRNYYNFSDPGYFFPALAGEAFRSGYSSSNVPRWKLIEFQAPNATGDSNDFMITNYMGQNLPRNGFNATNSVRNSHRYAELNAEIPSTLYQVMPTTPGETFYYSFYHATNGWPNRATSNPPPEGDRLHFYLSYVGVEQPDIVNTEAYSIIRDNAMVMIRPAQSPRSEPQGMTTDIRNMANIGTATGTANLRLNLSAWNSVAYDGVSGSSQYNNLSYHHGRSYLQPNGERSVQNIPDSGTYYLYDVWVDDVRNNIMTSTVATNDNVTVNGNVSGGGGGTRTGYGITFWVQSNTPLTVNNAVGSDTNIPMNGITQGQLETGTWPWLAAARTNVIGYWDVSYGWKHFYGEYTVPEGQTQTEFAFQSRSDRMTTGNYLDGVSFKSPSFLTIDKYVRDGITASANTVTYVKPNDNLYLELHVRNYGELEASNIEIVDRLWPFDLYVDAFSPARLAGMSVIWVDAAEVETVLPASAYTANYTGGGIIAPGVPPNPGGTGGTLTVRLGEGQTLSRDERLIIRIPMRIRGRLNDNLDASETLLYYFRNKAYIDYSLHLGRYDREIKKNASGPDPLQIFIDPVLLSKSVAILPEEGAVIDPAVSPVDGPFVVTLRVEDAEGLGGIETNGLLTDVIAAGFTMQTGGLDRGRLERRERNGSAWTDWEVVQTASYTVAYNPEDRTSRLSINRVRLGDNASGPDSNVRAVEYRYALNYTGTGFGVTEIHTTADYKYLYRDDTISGGDELDVMLTVPRTVVGVSIKTQDDDFTATVLLEPVPPPTSLPLQETQIYDLLLNDIISPMMAGDNYDVTTAIIFCDEVGEPLTATSTPAVIVIDSNQQLDTDYYTATIAQAGIFNNWRLHFTPKYGASGTHTLYYKIEARASKPGSPTFILDSEPTQVDITVVPYAP